MIYQWNECRNEVLSNARDEDERARMERGLRLADPFFDLVNGQRRLAKANRVTPVSNCDLLSRLVGLNPDEPIVVVAHPWSRRSELPGREEDYQCFFSTVFLMETASAYEVYGEETYHEMQRCFIDMAGGEAFTNVLCYDDQPVGLTFDPGIAAALARGLTSVGTLSVLYALYGDVDGISRLAPYVRYHAQVLPVGFINGDPALHVLCDD